jgi:hypothetical protein
VIRNELLLRPGDTLDASRLAESERTLRNLNIFQRVTIDTATIDDQFALVVSTQDGWTLSPKMSIATAGGAVTVTAGMSERNFLGTANELGVFYNKEVDRTGWEFDGHINRFARSRVMLDGNYRALSDGDFGTWQVGVPYRAFPDRWALEILGYGGDRRVFQYRQENDLPLDTTTYRRRVASNRLTGGVSVFGSSEQYLRLGVNVETRLEQFVLANEDPTSLTDSTFFAFGFYAKYAKSRFFKGRFWQGMGQDEDIDLSTQIELTAWVAPKGVGYERTGIGPEVRLVVGGSTSRGYAIARIETSGLFTSAGLDSGRVDAAFTASAKLAERHVSFLHVRAGVQKNPPPGEEWDLGFNFGPRTFGPHAFVGTRNIWGTFEQRWYGNRDFLGLLRFGLAAFADLGGAWYSGQERRFGGNAGLAVLFGSPVGTSAGVGRLAMGIRFGDRPEGGRLGIAFGGGFDFFTGDAGGGR